MAKNSRQTLSVKRKLSTDDSGRNVTKKIKKLKTAEKHKEKEDSVVSKDSNKRTVTSVKKSNQKSNSVKKITKENKSKNQTKNAQKVVKSTLAENCQSSQESSDDQLPLSELLKRNKLEKNVEEKCKTKKYLPVKTTKEPKGLSSLPKPVDAKIKLSKSVVTTVKIAEETCLKGSDRVSSSPKGKQLATSVNENSPANLKKAVNKDSKITLSNKEESKGHSPTKRKRNVTESGGAKEKGLIKDRGHSPVKTKSGKESSHAGKKQTEGQALMNEIVKEMKVGERIVKDSDDDDDDDGEESDMDWEDVAGGC